MTTPLTQHKAKPMTLDELIQELIELRERLGTGHYETGVRDITTHAGNRDTLPHVILHK